MITRKSAAMKRTPLRFAVHGRLRGRAPAIRWVRLGLRTSRVVKYRGSGFTGDEFPISLTSEGSN